MNEYVRKDFGKILKHQGLEARRWMKLTDSNVARVYDRNLEELPVTVELYDSYARIVDFSDEGFEDEEIIEVEDNIVLKAVWEEVEQKPEDKPNEDKPSDSPSDEQPSKPKSGCRGSIVATWFSLLILAGALFVNKKRRNN